MHQSLQTNQVIFGSNEILARYSRKTAEINEKQSFYPENFRIAEEALIASKTHKKKNTLSNFFNFIFPQ